MTLKQAFEILGEDYYNWLISQPRYVLTNKISDAWVSNQTNKLAALCAVLNLMDNANKIMDKCHN